LAGIHVFATGGLGGVHRGANESFDESADLTALANVDMTMICAGVKSILDVPATLERLRGRASARLRARAPTQGWGVGKRGSLMAPPRRRRSRHGRPGPR
jgi:hypothetical protein